MAGSAASAVPAGLAPRIKQAAADYIELTKPKVQSLLLLSTIATMFVAGGPLSFARRAHVPRWVPLRRRRRRRQPLVRQGHRRRDGAHREQAFASGRVSPAAALTFGCSLAALSFLELSLTVNVLAASLSFAGFVGYVLVYTVWLKRRTPQNIVIGGAAGAVPPLVGWAAVRGSVSGTAVLLFFIVFFWTPPHFWALSLLMKGEYEKVGVPMLPVARGEAETRKQILLYTVLLYAVTQLPFCAGGFGVPYLVGSLLLGLGFIWGAARLYRSRPPLNASTPCSSTSTRSPISRCCSP